ALLLQENVSRPQSRRLREGREAFGSDETLTRLNMRRRRHDLTSAAEEVVSNSRGGCVPAVTTELDFIRRRATENNIFRFLNAPLTEGDPPDGEAGHWLATGCA